MKKKSLLLIDNYDSFTYNLKHLILENSDINLEVRRNDENFIKEIEEGKFSGAIISPGPGSPNQEKYFGYNNKLISKYGTQGFPILGICLGFQGIYSIFGGKLKISSVPVHGKVNKLSIVEKNFILKGIPNHIKIMRYHSIIADMDKHKPDCFKYIAFAHKSETQINGKELMAIEHKDYPIYGIQFHPESFATEYGEKIIKNFLEKLND